MKLRTTCKCGAEFEARGLPLGDVGDAWDIWFRLHTRCLGIEGYRIDESGKLVYTPLVPVQADAGPSTATPQPEPQGGGHNPNQMAGPCMSTEEKSGDG